MSGSHAAPSQAAAARPAIGFFERYLTVWVALCIVLGIALGLALPGLFQRIGRLEYAQVPLHLGQVHLRRQRPHPLGYQLDARRQPRHGAREQHHARVDELAALYARHHPDDGVAVPDCRLGRVVNHVRCLGYRRAVGHVRSEERPA